MRVLLEEQTLYLRYNKRNKEITRHYFRALKLDIESIEELDLKLYVNLTKLQMDGKNYKSYKLSVIDNSSTQDESFCVFYVREYIQ
jgi:hypothetical protein